MSDLQTREDPRGRYLLLISCMIVAPNAMDYPS